MLHETSFISKQRLATTPLRVLVCPDKPAWAFDNIANNIEKFSGPNELSRLYMEDVIGNEKIFFETLFLKGIDLCHIFWREDLFYLLHPVTIDKAAQQMGLPYEDLVRAISHCAFTTSVYDHLFSSQPEMLERSGYFATIDGYTVSSQKLHSIYTAEVSLPNPDVIIPDGVDTSHFLPTSSKRNGTNDFTIGWAGNSAWGKNSKNFDVKGYHRLFQPMMEGLAQRGHKVEQKVADPQVKRIQFEDMPRFYNELDVFVCTSAMEGTPNTVLEAMACGIPVVSSDVGIVSEAFGELQKRFIIPRADKESFVAAVSELIANDQLREAISKENRLRALDWSWERKTKDWWPFWNRVLKRSLDTRNAARRELYLIAQAAIL